MLCSAPDFASSSLSEMGNTAGSAPVRYNDQIIRDLAKTSGLCESEVSQRSEDYYQGEESRGKIKSSKLIIVTFLIAVVKYFPPSI